MKSHRAIILLIYFLIFSAAIFPQHNIPQWAKGIVWYQIFPERFANGDAINDPSVDKVLINSIKNSEGWTVREWTSDWFAPSEWEKKLDGNVRDHMYERRYGGDLQGIIDRLDYLVELGIHAIYLNPVFEAVSLHKYDGSTFHHIDVNFGTNPEGDKILMQQENPSDPSTWIWTSADSLFLKFLTEAHNRDIRVVIDGVFNHVGIQFWAFQDLVEKGEQSQYKDWFIVNSFDDPKTDENEFDYKGWWNIKSLPEFNRTENDLHPGPKQYVFHATKRWMDPNNDGDHSDGIDGWRLDVARDVPLGFWKDWSRLVKSINSQSIIIGELWELSPDFISAKGPFDALMNYNFAFAVNDFFITDEKRIKASEFIERLKEIDKNYPEENLFILQNLVSSHDTERLSSMIANPDRQYDRDGHEGNTTYDPSKPSEAAYEKQKLIAAFQMTYRGAPMIYYGDEVGMWGADDPHCRKPMVWDEIEYDNEVITGKSGFKKGHSVYRVDQNKDLLSFYKKIISIRNNNAELKTGTIRFLYSNDKTNSFAFERAIDDNKIIAVFNLGETEDRFELPLDYKKISYKELLSGEEGSISTVENAGIKFSVHIPANSCKLYKIYAN
jgi:glycosidase